MIGKKRELELLALNARLVAERDEARADTQAERHARKAVEQLLAETSAELDDRRLYARGLEKQLDDAVTPVYVDERLP